MHLRPRFAILLLTCFPLAAQGAEDTGKAIADLTREKENLQREIAFAKARVADSRATLRNLGKQALNFRTIDAGKSTVAQPVAPPMAPRPARLMQDDERATFAGDTMLVVNSNPIRQLQFDELMAYQNTMPGDESAKTVRSMIALAELIRIEMMTTSFQETEVELKLGEALAALEGGTNIGDVIKAHGKLRGAAEDGAIEITRHTPHGIRLEQVAFSTPAGTRSRPFRHHTGIAIVQVDKVEKGASPDLDKVSAHVLVVPYAEDEAIAKIESLLAAGQVEIIARDKDVMKMLPAGYQDPEEVRAAAAVNANEGMRKAVAEIEAEMARLRDSDTPEDRAQLESLTQRHQKMKLRLDAMEKAKDGKPPEKKD